MIDQFINLLASTEWKDTTSAELWEDGLDFCEDDIQGRRLRTLEANDRILVRVDWSEPDPVFPEEQKEYCCLHIFEDDFKVSSVTVTLERNN